MSDQSDGNLNSVDKTNVTKRIDTRNRAFLDSVFFSSSTIIAMAVLVIISIFIMSWYVFSLKDREVQILKNQEWIDSSGVIIASAQKSYNEWMQLQDTIPRIKVTKQLLLQDVINVQNDHTKYGNELREIQAQITEKTALLRVRNQEIADAGNQLDDLRDRIPSLEKDNIYLERKKTRFQNEIDERIVLLDDLDENVREANNQLSEIKLQKISMAESDLNQIRSNLNNLITQFAVLQKDLQTSSTDLSSKVITFDGQSSQLDKEISTIQRTALSLQSSSQSISASTEQLNAESTGLQENNRVLKSVVDDLSDLSLKIGRSKTSINSLTKIIDTTQEDIDQLARAVRSSQISIESETEDIVPEIIRISESLDTILVKLPELQRYLLEIQSQVNQAQNP